MLLRVVVDVILTLSLSLSREKSSCVLCAARAQKKTMNEGNAFFLLFAVVDKIGSLISGEEDTRRKNRVKTHMTQANSKLKKKELKKGNTHTRHHKKKFVTTGG